MTGRSIHYLCRMEVNDEMVDKLAHLSRLSFGEGEKQEIKSDLQKMIGFVEKLGELPLEDTEPLVHLSGEVNVFRDDEVKGSITREEAFLNAPQHNGEFFMVPKVIKNPRTQEDK